MNAQIQWLMYGLLAIPTLLGFAIVNLWLCLQIKHAWRQLTGRRYGTNGYSSYRPSVVEKTRSRDGNGISRKESVAQR